MTIVKEELAGILTLSFGVDPLFVGTLAPQTPVKLSAVDQVAPYVGPGQPDFVACLGYVIIRNNKPNNDNRVVVATKGRAVITMTSGEAIVAGKPVTMNSVGKVVLASYREPQAGFRVMDFMWNGGETITVEGNTIIEGVHFFPGPTVQMTADQIANAIRMHMPNFDAQTNGTDRVFIRRRNNGPTFNNTNIPISTSDDGADIVVDPLLAHDGDMSIFDPYGIALTDCSGPDAPIDILVR
jgi:hypothetical protein